MVNIVQQLLICLSLFVGFFLVVFFSFFFLRKCFK